MTPIWTADRNRFGSWASLRRPLAALAPLRQRPDLAFAQRDQGHLGGREEATDENNDQDNENVPADAVHVWIPDLGS